MGIEPVAARVSARSAAGLSIVKPRAATSEPVPKPAETRGSPETSPEMHPARAAFVDQLQHAIRRAIERGDFARAANLADGLAAELRAMTPTSVDRKETA
jgi:hypothetical protein